MPELTYNEKLELIQNHSFDEETQKRIDKLLTMISDEEHKIYPKREKFVNNITATILKDAS
jgi:Txe/YoeB family toxin of Txe-Axe toxin-antitoxin module